MYTLRQPGVYDNDGEDEWIICLCERTTVQLLVGGHLHCYLGGT